MKIINLNRRLEEQAATKPDILHFFGLGNLKSYVCGDRKGMGILWGKGGGRSVLRKAIAMCTKCHVYNLLRFPCDLDNQINLYTIPIEHN